VTRRHRLSSKNQLQGYFEKGRTWLDAHECDLGLGKVVENFHVGGRRSLRCRRGPAVPERDMQRWTGRKSLYDMVFQTLEDACDQFFAPFPMIKQSHVAGNTGCWCWTWGWIHGGSKEYTSEGNMTAVQTCRIKFESLSECQYELSNIWIDRKVIYRLIKFYYQQSNFSYNSNSILKGLLKICSHEKDIEDKGRGRRGAVKQHTDEF